MNNSPPRSIHADFYDEEQRAGADRVSASYLRNEQVLVTFPDQVLLSDHPSGLGGTAKGPSPGELLLGALTACTAVYVGREARRQGVPVESVEVGASFQVTWEATDGPLESLGYFEKIVKHVDVVGDLNDAQRERVAFWVEHCSIGETLRRGVELEEHITWLPATGGGGRSAPTVEENADSADPSIVVGSCCVAPAGSEKAEKA
jgi:putative redox protein